MHVDTPTHGTVRCTEAKWRAKYTRPASDCFVQLSAEVNRWSARNIIPSKMAASNMDISSRITLANSSPSNRSYGSFKKSLESKGFKEHDVQPTDTLVGLSIKYNVPVSWIM